jgi:hypothetical protein
MKFRKGQSGNPRGKPSGTGKIEPLREQIRAAVPDIITAMVEQAKAGDVGAARLLLERSIPAVKPIQEPLKLSMDGDTLTAKASSIMEAVGRGDLVPSDAKSLLDGLAAVAKISEIEELRQRLEILERTLTQRGQR